MPVTFCRKCQGLVEPDQAFCTRCFTPVRKPSLLRRVFGGVINWIGGRTGVPEIGVRDRDGVVRTSTNITLRTSERFTIHDADTGQVREYSGIDQLPPQLRAQVEAALDQTKRGADATTTEQSITKRITTASDGSTTKQITVRGPDGIERHYTNIDDLPPDMRRMFEKFRNGEA
jgi:hypothetical protein